ncbi:MAG: YbaB/EbfC family nucleoid-associated protein [Lactobacillus sp.]|uniref:Nucleoid-associated protein DS831_00465 n=1 Tax=Bombilactobacillus bombi TaxID=1303590 RepID=A0A347SQ41_9LACO|nr:YbaB/EbfC family nucleoid-associated protein [Bombilactobacillus bombi]MCO6541501.1 YbaB/EbfC family nucleoid-associated protein [Lactobacillus sp.]AXX64150.1 YbaB/EbfC family nucleoid-associated protein [Bombilactobacillus bombi]MCO6543516.1 YbaB/EbfC family nucleoid-associated protein [Lactobacillus sp.]RHW45066.1 YbaB/EbfC family nucleoid-associated protein [Bombilactobacillus bombi]RHW51844.1 YbaB/EbfC family nucleoid-associated protein [Bombilactobacillus bombi]
MKAQMPGNMQNMLKQAQKLQKQMSQAQDQLNETEFIGNSADEMVKVVFTGNYQLKDIQIKPAAIDPDDPEMLQDLIIMAVNDAMDKIAQQTQQTLGQYTPKL